MAQEKSPAPEMQKPLERPTRLNLKRFIEDPKYRAERENHPALHPLYYQITTYEVANLLGNEEISFNEEQIARIRRGWQKGAARIFPLRKEGLETKDVMAEIGENLDEAVKRLKELDDILKEIKSSGTPEAKSAGWVEEIDLEKLDNPHYFLLLREENPHFQAIAEKERLLMIKLLLDKYSAHCRRRKKSRGDKVLCRKTWRDRQRNQAIAEKQVQTGKT